MLPKLISSTSPGLTNGRGNSGPWSGVGIGAVIIGTVAVIANFDNGNDAVLVAVVAVWLILAVRGLGALTVLVRKHRSPRRG